MKGGFRVHTTEYIISAAEIIGIAAFALSGAMVAIDRDMDLFGILFLGGVTALGGGTIRDILLGVLPPVMFYSYRFLLLSAVSSLAVFLLARYKSDWYRAKRERIEQSILVFDAIGLATFTVAGTQAAITAGYGDNGFMCVFLGMTTGIGGGVLRDMMSREMPFILRKRIYASASVAGSLLYYLLQRYYPDGGFTIWFSIALIATIRLLAARFRWSLPKAFPKRPQV